MAGDGGADEEGEDDIGEDMKVEFWDSSCISDIGISAFWLNSDVFYRLHGIEGRRVVRNM